MVPDREALAGLPVAQTISKSFLQSKCLSTQGGIFIIPVSFLSIKRLMKKDRVRYTIDWQTRPHQVVI